VSNDKLLNDYDYILELLLSVLKMKDITISSEIEFLQKNISEKKKTFIPMDTSNICKYITNNIKTTNNNNNKKICERCNTITYNIVSYTSHLFFCK
jgi:hypothetical protein